MKKPLKLIVSLAILVSAAVFAVGQKPQPATTDDKLPLIERLQFPEVEGWELGEKVALPTGEEGIVVNYDSPTRERVTVYVYRRGIEVPDKLTGFVKEEFEGARGAIRTVAEAGMYTDLKESKSETSNVGGAAGKVKSLHTQMTFKARGVKMNSEIFMFPYKGYGVKIRATRPGDVDKSRDEAYARLFAALDDLFSK